MSRLLSSEFAAPEETTPETPAGVEAPPAGEPGGERSPAEPEWSAEQRAWFALREQAQTAEEIAAADAQAPEFTPEQRAWIEQQSERPDGNEPPAAALPKEVLAQVEAWEKAGGTLPASLQEIVNKRIGREVGKVKDLEKRATDAEAEVGQLRQELQSRGQRPAAGVPGAMDEASLGKTVQAAERFEKDAHAFVNGFADDEQTRRIEGYMQQHGLDDKGLRRELHDMSQWLTRDVPKLQRGIGEFRSAERTATAEAAKALPDLLPKLDDPKTPEGKLAREVLELIPELKHRTPASKLAVAIYVLGFQEFQKRTATASNGNGQGKRFFLPGKAPVKAPAGGSPAAVRANGKQAIAEEQSRKLRENPTAENATESLMSALRIPVHTE